MEFLRQPSGRRLRLGEHLIERVVVRALLLRQASEGAEDAGLPEVADVGRIDVLIRRESHDVAVLAAVGVVGEHPDAEQIGRGEQKLGVRVRQAGSRDHLLADGSERRDRRSLPRSSDDPRSAS